MKPLLSLLISLATAAPENPPSARASVVADAVLIPAPVLDASF